MSTRLAQAWRRRARAARRPAWVAPMLATLTDQRELGDGWVFERKLDGIRALAFLGEDVRLLSRNRLDLSGRFPTIAPALRELGVSAIVDGEVIAVERRRSTFELLQQGRARVELHLFDIVHLDGYDVSALPLTERKQLLAATIEPGPVVKLTSVRTGASARLLEAACARGWEGLIAKRAEAPYVHGRSRDWLKLKCSLEQEFVVGGFSEPRGAREGIGALLLGVYDGRDLRYAGEVGTGFSHALLRDLRSRLERIERPRSPFADLDRARLGIHWVEPRLVVQVGFSEWTRAGRLRHPRFLGERTDKAPADVVREVPS